MPSDRSPFTLRAAIRRQAVLIAALVVLGVVVAVGATGRAPLAGTLLGIELVILAVLRLTLPTRVVGALAVRQRLVDAAVLLVLGLGTLALVGAPNL
ncbi:DUF3017 domain-containing protein [Brachybacterium huguangmaarense]